MLMDILLFIITKWTNQKFLWEGIAGSTPYMDKLCMQYLGKNVSPNIIPLIGDGNYEVSPEVK